jgi:hypothetical protein
MWWWPRIDWWVVTTPKTPRYGLATLRPHTHTGTINATLRPHTRIGTIKVRGTRGHPQSTANTLIFFLHKIA